MSAKRSEGALWSRPSGVPESPGASLHVWRIDLADRNEGRGAEEEDRAAAILSPDEVERLDRLRTGEARTRFQRSRVALREILAGYLATDPVDVVFDYGATGKPSLRRDHGARATTPDLHFNISHSGDVALCAVAESVDVGVDIERIRRLSDLERLASRHFSPAEYERWSVAAGGEAASASADAPHTEGVVEFFRIWTRKEALLKAAGYGLSRPLDRVDTLGGLLEEVSYWLADVLPGDGFTGAVACSRTPADVRHWRWDTA